jgi:hypothetical protein
MLPSSMSMIAQCATFTSRKALRRRDDKLAVAAGRESAREVALLRQRLCALVIADVGKPWLTRVGSP